MQKLDRFQGLVTDFCSKIDFLTVYIQEAHPKEGWFIPGNKVQLKQHTNLDERIKAAAILKEVGSNCPIVVDDFSNTGMLMYAAFPEALFVIDRCNILRYSAHGPHAYEPDDLRKWIENEVKKST